MTTAPRNCQPERPVEPDSSAERLDAQPVLAVVTAHHPLGQYGPKSGRLIAADLMDSVLTDPDGLRPRGARPTLPRPQRLARNSRIRLPVRRVARPGSCGPRAPRCDTHGIPQLWQSRWDATQLGVAHRRGHPWRGPKGAYRGHGLASAPLCTCRVLGRWDSSVMAGRSPPRTVRCLCCRSRSKPATVRMAGDSALCRCQRVRSRVNDIA